MLRKFKKIFFFRNHNAQKGLIVLTLNESKCKPLFFLCMCIFWYTFIGKKFYIVALLQKIEIYGPASAEPEYLSLCLLCQYPVCKIEINVEQNLVKTGLQGLQTLQFKI